MSMYDDETSFGDFEFGLDDLLIARLIEARVFATLTGEHYAIVRATVRSELLYSDEIGALIKPQINKLMERVAGIADLHFKVPGGVSLYGGGRLQAAAADLAEGRRPEGPSALRARAAMYGTSFLGFDDILLERFLPARTLASLKSEELAAIGALVKAELVYSDKVHAHLKRRIQQTIKELPAR